MNVLMYRSPTYREGRSHPAGTCPSMNGGAWHPVITMVRRRAITAREMDSL